MSILENLLVGNKNISHDKMIEYCKLYDMHNLFKELGYSKQVGERGKNLSGGQRQKICFMRATINDFTMGKIKHDRIISISIEFFILIAGNKNSRQFIKKDYMFILANLILPIQSYNNSIKEAFEYDDEKYLTERYNFIPNNLRSGSSNLFVEMVQSNEEIETNLFLTLKNFLDDKSNPNYLAIKYGIIGLFADSQKQLERAFGKDNFISFISNYIFPEVCSEHTFIVSQALYFISFCDGAICDHFNQKDNKLNSIVIAPLKRCIELVNLDNEILSVEACLAMNFFFLNSNLNNLIRPFIPNLLESIALF